MVSRVAWCTGRGFSGCSQTSPSPVSTAGYSASLGYTYLGTTETLKAPPVLTSTSPAYTHVSSVSLRYNWHSTFPDGTLYYVQISKDYDFGFVQNETYTTLLYAEWVNLSTNTWYYTRVSTNGYYFNSVMNGCRRHHLRI